MLRKTGFQFCATCGHNKLEWRAQMRMSATRPVAGHPHSRAESLHDPARHPAPKGRLRETHAISVGIGRAFQQPGAVRVNPEDLVKSMLFRADTKLVRGASRHCA